MGINLAAGGGSSFSYEGQPWSQDRVLEARGFCNPITTYNYCTLDAKGWPVGDFGILLSEGEDQDWWKGTFKCGFEGTGTEVVTGFGGTVVKTSGTSPSVRFDFTPTSRNFGFSVAGTTAHDDRNLFAYLPAYAAQAVNGYSPVPLIRNEFVAMYSKLGYMRDMWFANAWNNSTLTSWANRNSAANTKTNKGWGGKTVIGYPLEWWVAIVNACKVDSYNCMPINDDGTYCVGAAAYLKANLLGKCFLEPGNEVWNGVQAAGRVFIPQATAAGLTPAQYLANRLHMIATAFKAAYGADYGTKAQVIAAWQTGSNGVYILKQMLQAYTTMYGPPSADMHWLANAPYTSRYNVKVPGDGVNHQNAPDTVAQIQAEWMSNGSYIPWLANGESLTALAIIYGLTGGVMSYEMGPDASENRSPTTPFTASLGAAAMDPGSLAVNRSYLQAFFNAGYKKATWFESGVNSANDNLAPYWHLSNNTTQLETVGSPKWNAVMQFTGGYKISHRNTVAGPGTVIAGANYLDHNTVMGAAGPSLVGSAGVGVSQNDAGGWLLYSPLNAPATYTLSTPAVQGSGVTNVLINGAVVSSGVNVASGATLGPVTLQPGFNYLEIGNGKYVPITSIDSLALN